MKWLGEWGEFGHTVELTMELLACVHDIFVLTALSWALLTWMHHNLHMAVSKVVKVSLQRVGK